MRAEIDDDRFEVLPDDEDVHMAIERRLTEIVGPAGGKLHTARSRNDQVATDVAMLVRAHALSAKELLHELMGTLADLAERHLDWPMPGYTHLQRAQPVYLSHHLLAYFWKFRRDLQRFNFCLTATDDLPLGAGALAGVNFDTSRMFVAQELGFAGIAENSLDAVSNRDFVLDYLGAAATCATHLSQLGGEIVLWSSEEFGFCEVDDAFASGSSLMPQKKNPDAAELLRAKAPRVVSRLVRRPRRAPRAAAHLQQGPPGGQGAALRRDRHRRARAPRWRSEMLAGIEFDRERMAAAASDEFIAATDVADAARQAGRAVPRGARDRGRAGAHRGRARQAAVRADRRRAGRARPAARSGRSASCSSPRPGSSPRSREGGTSLARVRDQLAQARHVLDDA